MNGAIGDLVTKTDERLVGYNELQLHFHMDFASGPCMPCCGPLCCSHWRPDHLDWQQRPTGELVAIRSSTRSADDAPAPEVVDRT